jgi:hypothetical protein
MPKGALYVYLYYPGYIGLTKGVYQGELNGRLFSVRLVDHLRPLEILDFDNRMEMREPGLFEPANKEWSIDRPYLAVMDGSQLLCFLHKRGDHHRLFYPRSFTHLIISYEIETAPEFTDDEFAFHERVLDHFINLYRCITNDVKITLKSRIRRNIPVAFVAVVVYEDEELKLSQEERLYKVRNLGFALRQFSIAEFAQELPRVNHDIEEASRQMGVFRFSSDQIALVDAYEELLLDRNFRSAFLSAFTISEVMVRKYLHELKLKRGASKGKLDEFEAEIPFSYLLNVELPTLIGNLTDEERQILGAVDRARKKRNAIIHKGEDVSQQEVVDTLNAVKNLRGLLTTHPL